MFRCHICDKPTSDIDGLKHHICHSRIGGNDNKENLIRICSGCHGLIHSINITEALKIASKQNGFWNDCLEKARKKAMKRRRKSYEGKNWEDSIVRN